MIKNIYSKKAIGCKNMMFLTLVLLPIVSFTFYPNHMVIGQEKQENYASKNNLICQLEEYIKAPIGSNMQQVFNICSYQKSIGYNQSIAELCFIFSGNSIDIINAYCDKVSPNQTSTPPVAAPTATAPTATAPTATAPTATAPTATAPTSPVVNENNATLNSQNNVDDGSKLTIFDGITKFFSGAFNP